MKTIQIAIDGPASSGKSTVAKIIAKDFGYTYLDTGAMYRAATYIALKNQISPNEPSQLLELLEQYPISFGRAENGEQLVFVGDVDVTNPIRENEVTNAVSAFAAIPAVREKLVALQQEIAQQGGIVMDGRDIGTVVLPKAELKIFLVAMVARATDLSLLVLCNSGVDVKRPIMITLLYIFHPPTYLFEGNRKKLQHL